MGQSTTISAVVPKFYNSAINSTPMPGTPRRNYPFADNVRFLSIAAVVFMHTVTIETAVGVDPKYPHLLWVLLQFCKFGTIAFFLISGFLMAESMSRIAPLAYLKRRLANVALPWLVWFSLYGLLWVLYDAASGRYESVPASRIASVMFERIADRFLLTSYWFVPNLIVSICLILIFRRFLFDVRLGGALLLLSMFYGINIHAHWIASNHTEAIFGFVFYLWLGAWCWRKYNALQRWIDKVPITALVTAGVLLGALALSEGLLLERLGSIDCLNTLRITNQAYSIVAVLIIVKLRTIPVPKAVSIRRATYGIYLLHPIVLDILKYFAKRVYDLPMLPWITSTFVFYVIGVGSFVCIYCASLGATQFLASSPRLCWLVGQTAKPKTA